MENSLFGLAAYERAGEAVVRGSENQATGEAIDEEPAGMSPDPLIDSGLAQAKSLEQHSDLLIRLSLYIVRELVRADQKRKAKEHLEGILLRALKSKPEKVTSAWWSKLHKEIRSEAAPHKPARS